MTEHDRILNEVRYLAQHSAREIWSDWVDYCDSGITIKEYLDTVMSVITDYFECEYNTED